MRTLLCGAKLRNKDFLAQCKKSVESAFIYVVYLYLLEYSSFVHQKLVADHMIGEGAQAKSSLARFQTLPGGSKGFVSVFLSSFIAVEVIFRGKSSTGKDTVVPRAAENVSAIRQNIIRIRLRIAPKHMRWRAKMATTGARHFVEMGVLRVLHFHRRFFTVSSRFRGSRQHRASFTTVSFHQSIHDPIAFPPPLYWGYY